MSWTPPSLWTPISEGPQVSGPPRFPPTPHDPPPPHVPQAAGTGVTGGHDGCVLLAAPRGAKPLRPGAGKCVWGGSRGSGDPPTPPPATLTPPPPLPSFSTAVPGHRHPLCHPPGRLARPPGLLLLGGHRAAPLLRHRVLGPGDPGGRRGPPTPRPGRINPPSVSPPPPRGEGGNKGAVVSLLSASVSPLCVWGGGGVVSPMPQCPYTVWGHPHQRPQSVWEGAPMPQCPHTVCLCPPHRPCASVSP